MNRIFYFIITLSVLLILNNCGGGGGGGQGDDTIPPSIPVLVAANAISLTQIDLAWNASTDNVAVAGYNVYRNGILVDTIVNTSFSDIGLNPDITYCYSLASYDAAGNKSAQSDSQAWCIKTGSLTPSAPSGVVALGSSGGITLRWEPVASAISYNLYVANVAGISKQNYTSLQGGGKIENVSSPYVHTGLTNLTTYFYVITAVNAYGESVESQQIALQPISPVAQGWKSLQPAFTTNALNALRFMDASTGWAVGNAGTILYTGNAGFQWTLQDSRTVSSLSSVDFVDILKGWAVGGAGSFGQTYATILHTSDGGTTWRTQASGNVPALSGVDFVDAQNGWAVGENGVILHTPDGGKHWYQQTSGTNASLWKVKFTSTTTGWVAGGNGYEGIVLKTLDGGSTWSQQSINGAQLYALDFTSDTHGCIADVATPGRIFGTNNGGLTWGALPTGTTSYLHAINFVDATTGWSVGSSGTILKTTTGGASWAAQSGSTMATLFAVAAIDGQTAWAVGAGGVILHTGDGGATWNRQDFRTLPPVTTGTLSFPNATTGWAAYGSTPYKTTNGGATWEAQPIFSSEPLGWIQFVNESTGWAVGSVSGVCESPPCYGVYRTVDSGMTWESRGHIATSRIQIWNVDFLDALHGWAVGVNGVIQATSDGGITWTPKVSGTPGVLTAVKAVDTSTIWVVGTGGIILKSTDGGTTWLGQISGTTQDLRAIAATDTNRAWVVGGNSSASVAPLIATTNGGATWIPQNQYIMGAFSDVYFVNPTTGWAVGWGGIFTTTNGGSTWTRQNSGTAKELYRVRFADSQTGWIIAEGDLLGTTTGGN